MPCSSRWWFRSCDAGAPRRFIHKPLDFDQFMEVVVASGADPYLVLNYSSANNPPANPGEAWDYDLLRDAAESWVAYIVRKGYQVGRTSSPRSIRAAATRLLAFVDMRGETLLEMGAGCDLVYLRDSWGSQGAETWGCSIGSTL